MVVAEASRRISTRPSHDRKRTLAGFARSPNHEGLEIQSKAQRPDSLEQESLLSAGQTSEVRHWPAPHVRCPWVLIVYDACLSRQNLATVVAGVPPKAPAVVKPDLKRRSYLVTKTLSFTREVEPLERFMLVRQIEYLSTFISEVPGPSVVSRSSLRISRS